MKMLSKQSRVLSVLCVLFLAVVLFVPNTAEAAISVRINPGERKSITVPYSGETISVTLIGNRGTAILRGKPSWIACTKSGSRFTLTVTKNASDKARTGDVVFTEGNNVWTLRITQNGVPKINVTFKDGDTTISTKKVTYGSTYGTLPNPVKAEYIFNGWYTAASGGTKVTPSTKVTKTADHTLYARWTKGKKVLVINFDPELNTGKKVIKQHELNDNWQDPHDLANQFIEAMKEVSYGNVKYSIADFVDVNAFPQTKEGKAYTAKDYYNTYVKAMAETDGAFWQYNGWKKFYPDGGDRFRFDYKKYFKDYNVYNRINKGEIDEVWFFAGPMIGFDIEESIMVGKNAFWLNGTPIVEKGVRNFAVFGFNYERKLGCMLESAGHRMECTMNMKFFNDGNAFVDKDNFANKTYKQLNDWEKFNAYEGITGGKIIAGVGSVHHGPSSKEKEEHEWNDTNKVKSFCDNWLQYPNIDSGAARLVNCSEWGGGKDVDIDIVMEGHHKWWFKHIPHASGSSNGKYNNWWKYFLFEDLK